MKGFSNLWRATKPLDKAIEHVTFTVFYLHNHKHLFSYFSFLFSIPFFWIHVFVLGNVNSKSKKKDEMKLITIVMDIHEKYWKSREQKTKTKLNSNAEWILLKENVYIPSIG